MRARGPAGREADEGAGGSPGHSEEHILKLGGTIY